MHVCVWVCVSSLSSCQWWPRILCLLSLWSNTKKSVLPCQPIKALDSPPPVILFGCPSLLAFRYLKQQIYSINVTSDDTLFIHLSAFECKSQLALILEFVENAASCPMSDSQKCVCINGKSTGLSATHEMWRFMVSATALKTEHKKLYFGLSLVLICAPLFILHVLFTL